MAPNHTAGLTAWVVSGSFQPASAAVAFRPFDDVPDAVSAIALSAPVSREAQIAGPQR